MAAEPSEATPPADAVASLDATSSRVEPPQALDVEGASETAALALNIAGMYQSKSVDGKGVMLMQIEESGHWTHVARRADSTQYYWFPAPKGVRDVAARQHETRSPWWWPFGYICLQSPWDVEVEPPRVVGIGGTPPENTTVSFWEMAQSSGTWWPGECGKHAVDIFFSCEECSWSHGQSDPSVHIYQLHKATPLPQERKRTQELVASGGLTMRYLFSGDVFGDEGACGSQRTMALRPWSTSAGTHVDAVGNGEDVGDEQGVSAEEAILLAEHALGFMGYYTDSEFQVVEKSEAEEHGKEEEAEMGQDASCVGEVSGASEPQSDVLLSPVGISAARFQALNKANFEGSQPP